MLVLFFFNSILFQCEFILISTFLLVLWTHNIIYNSLKKIQIYRISNRGKFFATFFSTRQKKHTEKEQAKQMKEIVFNLFQWKNVCVFFLLSLCNNIHEYCIYMLIVLAEAKKNPSG